MALSRNYVAALWSHFELNGEKPSGRWQTHHSRLLLAVICAFRTSSMLPEAFRFPGKWAGKLLKILHIILSYAVFLGLDLADTLFCIVFKLVDQLFEGNPRQCYCVRLPGRECHDGENGLSDTLYGRKNWFRKMGFIGFARICCKPPQTIASDHQLVNRWSDCGCASCLRWSKSDHKKLYFVVKEPSHAAGDSKRNGIENVIFIHGFLCSSSMWTETVFQNLSESVQNNYRVIAIDLLGFGNSPKPRDSFYTLKEHLERIENSVINPLDLKSFHVVAHSMGCTVALAVAAKYSESVKSLTLVAPPYLPSSKTEANFAVLSGLAERRLWPPLSFGVAFMSWYEHLGRCVCFFVCRNHRVWERIIKLFTGRRDLPFMIMDVPKHTHHSAWHSMHNVVCGGAKCTDDYLETLIEDEVKLYVIQGDKDHVVPVECSFNIKKKVPNAEVSIIVNANHSSVILGRERDFTETLERIWVSSSADVVSRIE